MIKRNSTLLITILITILGYIFIHDLLGGTLLKHAYWDSYTLQAIAWRNGNISLDQNFGWLEIAYYNNNYYLSFPPLPSVLILPFTLIFDPQIPENILDLKTPSNAIIAGYTILCLIAVYKIFEHFNTENKSAAFWSIFIVLGSNIMFMSVNGGVWFQAQILSFMFCAFAILAAIKNKRILSIVLVAFAVGCRPFALCYFPVLLVYFITQDRKELDISFSKTILKQWRYLILPIFIIGVYMTYNYVRFKNPFEFGHNYLPEFSNGDSQFSLQYLFTNLGNLFRPVIFTEDMDLIFPSHNGFMFFFANPIFILYFVEIIKDIIKKKITLIKISIISCFLVNFFLLLIHKTFGGWQFGVRYMVDLIPFVVFYLILNGKRDIKRWEFVIGIFAIMFNIYGMFKIWMTI